MDEDYTQDANGNITAVAVGARGSESNRLQKTMATTVHAQDQVKAGKFTFTPGVRVETINQKYCDDSTNCGTSLQWSRRARILLSWVAQV